MRVLKDYNFLIKYMEEEKQKPTEDEIKQFIEQLKNDKEANAQNIHPDFTFDHKLVQLRDQKDLWKGIKE